MRVIPQAPESRAKTANIIPTMDLIGTDTRQRWSYVRLRPSPLTDSRLANE
jgi:hypothetical protein